MPSLTQPFPKKRRRDEEDPVTQDIHLSFPQDVHDYYSHQQQHGTSSRKIIPYPSPLAKKIRMSSERSPEEPLRQAPLTPSSRHNKNHQIRSPAPAAATTKLHQSPSKTAAPTNLSPCHICHRKPTKKTELDSYADCEGCGERTCYVCIRECLGWKGTTPTSATHDHDEMLMKDDDDDDDDGNDDHGDHDDNSKTDEDNDVENWGHGRLDQSFSMEDAPSTEEGNRRPDQDRTKRGGTWGKGGGRGHRGRICSQCCVEDGPEGEVICLGCLGT